MQVRFNSTPIDNKCEGGETMILVNANGEDIVLQYDSPRTITFTCEKVIWENGDYFPQRDYTIHPGYLAFFNPCLNDQYIMLEIRPVKGGKPEIIRFEPQEA